MLNHLFSLNTKISFKFQDKTNYYLESKLALKDQNLQIQSVYRPSPKPLPEAEGEADAAIRGIKAITNLQSDVIAG